jgi:hypothetical protein
MKTLYKIEMFAAIVGVFVVAMFLLPTPPTLTGYVSGLNITIYSQDLDIMVDGSKSYTLTTADGNLHLKSFMIDGEVLGNGSVEILLDNGKGKQYLVYDNVEEIPDYSAPHFMRGMTAGITGMAIDEEIIEKRGIYLVVQEKNPINYEFNPLKENEETVPGGFYSVCKETCNMPKYLFNHHTYELIFRLEAGTTVRLNEIKYILQEDE